MIKAIFHHIMTIIGLIMLPFLYFGLVLGCAMCGCKAGTFAQLFASWNAHRRSGDAWGPFDCGW